MPSGRTSMLELPANGLLATHPACSERRHHQPCRRSHERQLGDQTKDDADKQPREERSCGRSQTLLYNGQRPHSALGYLTPAAYAANLTATCDRLRNPDQLRRSHVALPAPDGVKPAETLIAAGGKFSGRSPVKRIRGAFYKIFGRSRLNKLRNYQVGTVTSFH